MKKRRILSALILICGLVVFMAAPVSVLAATATAQAETKGGGQNCGKVSKKSGQNTGGMTVKEVKVGDDTYKEGVDYNIRRGTNGSTRPVIEFVNPLPSRKTVKVTLDTEKGGNRTFEVNLELTDC